MPMLREKLYSSFVIESIMAIKDLKLNQLIILDWFSIQILYQYIYKRERKEQRLKYG